MTTNLLVIMSDEHQARAMGVAGHPFVRTPNLDALAARGVLDFEDLIVKTASLLAHS